MILMGAVIFTVRNGRVMAIAQLFIRYVCVGWAVERELRQPINGFCFDGDTQYYIPSNFPENTTGEVKCRSCRSNNWRENGRSINEYECAGCGAFVTVEPKNG